MKVPVRGYVTLLAVAVVAAVLTLGCSAPGPRKVVTNPDPSGKIPAYKEAVRDHDCKAVRQMVKDLDSDDPAIRLFAIEGLRRLTGETLDYKYYEDEHARRPALKRWQAWLNGETGTKKESHQQPDREAAVAGDSGGSNGGAATADGDAPSKASGP